VACGEELLKRRPVTEPVLRDHGSRLERRESELAALGGTRPQWVTVQGAAARIHQKPGGRPCLRLVYMTDVGAVSDWLALEHPSQGARWHAGQRWRALSRTPWIGVPSSAELALARVQGGELRRPARLLIEQENGWPRIKATEFAEPEPVA
jgi:hypothetical protein